VKKGNATRPGIKLGICGEHGGDPDSVKFCHKLGLNYVSCCLPRRPSARSRPPRRRSKKRTRPRRKSKRSAIEPLHGRPLYRAAFSFRYARATGCSVFPVLTSCHATKVSSNPAHTFRYKDCLAGSKPARQGSKTRRAKVGRPSKRRPSPASLCAEATPMPQRPARAPRPPCPKTEQQVAKIPHQSVTQSSGRAEQHAQQHGVLHRRNREAQHQEREDQEPASFGFAQHRIGGLAGLRQSWQRDAHSFVRDGVVEMVSEDRALAVGVSLMSVGVMQPSG